MPNNKSPGIDGLTIEVYKVFWAKLGNPYFLAIKYLESEGKLSLAMRRGIISLIPKKDRDLTIVDNWRPITMLTCDYKILAKALALRMQKVLPTIISDDQTGFMKGRNIADNIRKTIDVVSLAFKSNTPHLVMTIDFQKCFDFLEHEAIWGSLQYFGFGDRFIEWVKLLYNDIQLSVCNNGFLSKYVSVSRSTLQGSPIAAFLYLCCGQVLHDLIMQNSQIEGFNMQDVNALISQFADDTTLYLRASVSVLREVVRTLEIFHKNTGLVINYDKTCIYRIGSLANSDAQIYTTRQFHWTNQPIELLGVKIPVIPDDKLICTLNYENVVCKMNRVLTSWSTRNASLSARVLIVNTLIASLFVYKMQVLPDIDIELLQRIDNCIYDFVWHGKQPKIARNILIRDKSQGGLRLVNLKDRQRALKVQWFTRLNEEKDNFFKKVFYKSLKMDLKEFVWKCNLSPHDSGRVFLNNADTFWVQVYKGWCAFNFSSIDSTEVMADQSVWLNSNILINSQPFIFYRAWQAGIAFLRDLFNADASLKTARQVQLEFGNVLDWFQYIQISRAISLDIRCKIDIHSFGLSRYTMLSNAVKISNIIYSELIKNDRTLESRRTRWERILKCSISTKEFLIVFRNIQLQTIATKFRDFQYRLLTCIIPTNRKLYLWKLKDSQKCTFCDHEEENEIHLFVECGAIQNVWDALKDFIRTNDTTGFQTVLNWSASNIIFSTVHPSPANVINFLVTITKQYIYKVRCINGKPFGEHLLLEIENIYQIEESLAIKKGKWCKHKQKWGNLKNLPDQDEDYVTEYLRSQLL